MFSQFFFLQKSLKIAKSSVFFSKKSDKIWFFLDLLGKKTRRNQKINCIIFCSDLQRGPDNVRHSPPAHRAPPAVPNHHSSRRQSTTTRSAAGSKTCAGLKFYLFLYLQFFENFVYVFIDWNKLPCKKNDSLISQFFKLFNLIPKSFRNLKSIIYLMCLFIYLFLILMVLYKLVLIQIFHFFFRNHFFL